MLEELYQKGGRIMKKIYTMMALAFIFVIQAADAQACTSIRISTTDGYVFYARTMEGDSTYDATISIVPVGTAYSGTLPDNTQKGLKWAARYGFAGINNGGFPVITDGINEKGLTVGMLMFPGYAGYQAFDAKHAGRTISQFEFATWALSNFATADEVKAAVKNIRVSNSNKVGKLELHYTVHDAIGKSIVVEYSKGKLHVYNNPLGVMTNSPTFDWHLTNLKNYINLRAVNALALSIGDVTDSGFGQGTGMLGLPGDYTPPSRFVRMVALTQSALPVTGPEAGLNLAMTIINTCEIPKGVVRDMTVKPPEYDHAVWSAVADLKQLRYYYHTYDSKIWKYIDLRQALAGAKQVMSLPLFTKGVYENATGAAAIYTNPDPKFYDYENMRK
jgi:choloylglycine hydrolase